jgi:hypothetical protein
MGYAFVDAHTYFIGGNKNDLIIFFNFFQSWEMTAKLTLIVWVGAANRPIRQHNCILQQLALLADK